MACSLNVLSRRAVPIGGARAGVAWAVAVGVLTIIAGHARCDEPVLTIIYPESDIYALDAAEMNDAGEVLINRQPQSADPPAPAYWAAVWKQGVWHPLPVPTIASVCPTNVQYPAQYDSWRGIRANALNNSGTAAGGLLTYTCSGSFMAVWSRGDDGEWGQPVISRTSRNPDCLYPYPASGAIHTAIGDDGTAGGMGNAAVSNGCAGADSYLMVSPGGFLQGAASLNGIHTRIVDINNAGVAVGIAHDGSYNNHVQVWTAPDQVMDLGPGVARAINDLGWILTATGMWRDGQFTPFNPEGTPAEHRIVGLDVNDVGSVLGSTVVEIDGVRHTLASLGLSLLGYSQWSPIAINNHNEIVGNVSPNAAPTQTQVFILRPNLPCFHVTAQPLPANACPTGSAMFAVAVSTPAPIMCRWQVQTSPGVWQPLGNDPAPLPCAGGAFAYATPIDSPEVTIGIRPCPGSPMPPQHFQIRCIVTNLCGSVTSDEATYTVCPADVNCSGALSVQDIFDFLEEYFSGASIGDFNGSGAVSVQDIFDFLAAYFAGCV